MLDIEEQVEKDEDGDVSMLDIEDQVEERKMVMCLQLIPKTGRWVLGCICA